MKRRIVSKEIIRDLAGGMNEDVLKKKYDLSAEQLRAARNEVLRIRTRRVKAIFDDIQLGMSDSQLMEKYQLSRERLTAVKKGPIELQAVLAAGSRSPYIPSNGGTTETDFRKVLRNYPSVVVSVCEGGKPGTLCQLNDITEEGVGISGITAQIGETKTIVVLGDELGLVAPFKFQAECRWSSMEEVDGEPAAGFRITEISQMNFGFLREFVGQYTFAIESV